MQSPSTTCSDSARLRTPAWTMAHGRRRSVWWRCSASVRLPRCPALVVSVAPVRPWPPYDHAAGRRCHSNSRQLRIGYSTAIGSPVPHRWPIATSGTEHAVAIGQRRDVHKPTERACEKLAEENPSGRRSWRSAVAWSSAVRGGDAHIIDELDRRLTEQLAKDRGTRGASHQSGRRYLRQRDLMHVMLLHEIDHHGECGDMRMPSGMVVHAVIAALSRAITVSSRSIAYRSS